MSENLVNLTIDGVQVSVPKGTNLIEASKAAGVDVPHFCYHSHLSVAGNCRMCMVEVEGMRGPQIGCNTGANDGMVVKTDTDLIKEQRAAVMEFLLVNHPIDCPVCDQAGECKLQIYYMAHDRRDSVVDLDDKVQKGKAIEVGPRVMLDQERCVACSRCVRFCDEITGTGELRLLNRGDHTTISTFPGKPLANDYSVNTADICPVGALTSRDFRFQARAWYLAEDDSICPGCATGCNVKISHYKQVELQDYNGIAYRIRPRVNDEVNAAWMCDFGRKEYHQINDDRVMHPFAHSIEIGWDGALGHVKNAVGPLVERGGEAIAGVISYDATTEEVYTFRKLMREVFGQNEIAVVANRADGKSDDFLIDADKHPNRAGALLAAGDARVNDLASYLEGKAAVIVVGVDLLAEIRDDAVRQAFSGIKHKIVLAANRSETTEVATILLPTKSYAEKDGTFINRKGRVQRIFPMLRKHFACRAELEVMADLARAFGTDWGRLDGASVFAEMAGVLPALAGLDYGTLGKSGREAKDSVARDPGEEGLIMDGFGWLLLKAGIPWFLLLNMLPVMIFLERKGSALIADRVGPNRTFIPGLGLRLAGLVQNLADVVKLLTKEEFIPNHVNRRMYLLAPMFALFVALIVGMVIPFTAPMDFGEGRVLQIQALDANLGLLLLLSVSSLGVYAVTMAGWASNNKYSLMGGLRASAQMVSYELSMGLAVVGLFMVYGTTTLNEMVVAQGHAWLGIIPKWGVLLQPVGFVLFLIAGFAETNRTPFDMAEGESEIVGFHVEYGGIKFALFFMAEYIHMVIVALVTATCYFGGYQIPWVSPETLADPVIAGKVTMGILGAVGVAGLLIGLRLMKWHGKNSKIWRDSRRNEGAILAVLLGFGPAFTAAALIFFWGGDFGPTGAALMAGLLGFASLMAKTLFFCWLFVWVRWTLPRFRYDQLMALGWKLLVPIGIANIFITGILVKLGIW